MPFRKVSNRGGNGNVGEEETHLTPVEMQGKHLHEPMSSSMSICSFYVHHSL